MIILNLVQISLDHGHQGSRYFYRRDDVINERVVRNLVSSSLYRVDKAGEPSAACQNTIYCMTVVCFVHGSVVYDIFYNIRVAYVYCLLNDSRLLW